MAVLYCLHLYVVLLVLLVLCCLGFSPKQYTEALSARLKHTDTHSFLTFISFYRHSIRCNGKDGRNVAELVENAVQPTAV